MNLLKFLLISSLLITTLGCSKKIEEKISTLKGDQVELQMIETYQAGVTAFEKQNYLEAAKKFNEAELLFPQSDWAPKASLMAAYSYFSDNYYNDAINQLENFLKIYPKDNRASYAYYLLAMAHYNKIIDEKKDLEPLRESKKGFEYIVKNYPNTEYAMDSNFKLGLIEEVLASKEMYIAKHYIKKKKWIAAINRLKYIIDEYETTIYVEEALHRLVEVYYTIGLTDEAKKYATVLGYNYDTGDWYKKSYKIFNKDYKSSYKKIKKQKKTPLLKKLKSILE